MTPLPVGERLAALDAAGGHLRSRRIAEVVASLEAALARWRDPSDVHRIEGERALAAHWGVPPAAIAEVLDAAFHAWTADALIDWISCELGDIRALDTFVLIGGARRRAFGPRLLLALAARGVPTTPIGDLIAALVVKSPVWVKPATGADDLAARFTATIAECDPELGAAIEVSTWRLGPDADPYAGARAGDAVLAAADVVVATGGAETIVELHETVRPETHLVVHGPRLSAAIVTREALDADRGRVVEDLARDTAFAGQMGCLSPVVAWIEGTLEDAAELVAPLRAACHERWPCPGRHEAGKAERAAFAEWAALARVEAAAGLAGSWAGDLNEAWSVQLRMRAVPPAPPPVPRLLTLAPVSAASDVADLCARRRGLVAGVGIAGPPQRREELAPALAEAGVERVAPLGEMQRPPLAWRRDGRATLADLVRWSDLED